jgi:DNA-binding transcriptional MerR regulator
VTDSRKRLTIDQLARRVGMTVRNVRAYQSRGLIPPPDLSGRTGYYRREHVARLELIKDLQAEGFNLDGIKRLLDSGSGGSVGDVLDFTRALLTPFGDERPRVVDARSFTERWGDELTPELARRVLALGVIRELDEGRYEVRSPRLNQASEELANLGVPMEKAVEITTILKRHAEAVARAYVELFLEHVWRPFERSGEPSEEWPRVREALDRMRPLAGESLLAMFQLVMTDAVEEALQAELTRLAEAPPELRAAEG